MMTARGGRPKKSTDRKAWKRVQVYLTPQEFKAVTLKAQIASVSLSTYGKVKMLG